MEANIEIIIGGALAVGSIVYLCTRKRSSSTTDKAGQHIEPETPESFPETMYCLDRKQSTHRPARLTAEAKGQVVDLTDESWIELLQNPPAPEASPYYILPLEREGNNEQNGNAVRVLNEEWKHVGYLEMPEKENLTRQMDAGRLAFAYITDAHGGQDGALFECNVKIGVYEFTDDLD